MPIFVLLGNSNPSIQTKFVEPILDKIIETLQDGMTDQCSGISDEYSDFELVAVADADYFVGEQGTISQYPAIEVYPDSSPGVEYDAYSLMVTHSINIRAWATDDDQTRLQRRIWRYQRAITELLKADHTLSGYVSMIRFTGHTYEPMNQTDYGAYLYGGTVTIEVDNEETTR